MRLIDADALIKILEPHSMKNGAALGWHSGLIDAVIDEIRKMPTIGGWISVKDRLPPMYHMVLITGKNSAGGSFGIIKGSHDGDIGQWYRDDIGQYVDSRGDIVTHWMPLPEPPKEG